MSASKSGFVDSFVVFLNISEYDSFFKQISHIVGVKKEKKSVKMVNFFSPLLMSFKIAKGSYCGVFPCIDIYIFKKNNQKKRIL